MKTRQSGLFQSIVILALLAMGQACAGSEDLNERYVYISAPWSSDNPGRGEEQFSGSSIRYRVSDTKGWFVGRTRHNGLDGQEHLTFFKRDPRAALGSGILPVPAISIRFGTILSPQEIPDSRMFLRRNYVDPRRLPEGVVQIAYYTREKRIPIAVTAICAPEDEQEVKVQMRDILKEIYVEKDPILGGVISVIMYTLLGGDWSAWYDYCRVPGGRVNAR